MSKFELSHQVYIHYSDHNFSNPWDSSEAILFLHGNAESHRVWFNWIPHLARHYRVICPDMRGFGESTPMPLDHVWSLHELVHDAIRLMDHLGIERFHLVGAKLGGTVARRFAATYPDKVLTLTLAGTPAANRGDLTERTKAWTLEFETHGVARWAEQSMRSRLGAQFPDKGVQWWIDLMSKTPVSSQIGFMKVIPSSVITDDLQKIVCPTLVITTQGSALGSADEVKSWQREIKNSKLVVLPGDSYHVAASHGDECAQLMLSFIKAV